MNPTVPAGTTSGRRRPSRNGSGDTTASPRPSPSPIAIDADADADTATDAIAVTNRVAIRPPDRGMCGCPTPLVHDPETGEWLHLATGSRCPNRSDGAR